MKNEDITKYNDAETSENLVEEFDTPNTQFSDPNPKLYLFIVLNNNTTISVFFNFI